MRVRKSEKNAVMRQNWILTLEDSEKRLSKAMERDDKEMIDFYTEKIGILKKALATR